MLHRPWSAPLIVTFWAVTMGWLVTAKIVPSLTPGLPPGYQALHAGGGRLIPVAWTVEWNGRPIGWALAETSRDTDGGLIVENRLSIDELPLDKVVPGWTGSVVRRLLERSGPIALDARGRIAIDPEGTLRSFQSLVNVPGSRERIVLDGTVHDGDVTVHVRAGEMRYETTRHLPSTVMIRDELSPHAMLPGLHEGRRWTVPVYSPLRAGGTQIEILHAHVGAEETTFWDGRLARVHVVEYRDDPGSGRDPRCRLWVDLSGRVLRQECVLLGARLAFVRRTDDAAARLAESPPAPRVPGIGGEPP